MRCNHTKQHPAWQVHVRDGTSRGRPHRTRVRTPLGYGYDSTAPPLLYSATPRFPGQTYEPDSPIELALHTALHHPRAG